jgi:hypothetical protein
LERISSWLINEADMAPSLLADILQQPAALMWIAVLTTQLIVLARALSCPTRGEKSQTGRRAHSSSRQLRTVSAPIPRRLSPVEQIERLASIVGTARTMAASAADAHAAAARLLDSADYQFQRLFEDNPVLAHLCQPRPLIAVRAKQEKSVAFARAA